MRKKIVSKKVSAKDLHLRRIKQLTLQNLNKHPQEKQVTAQVIFLIYSFNFF